MSWKILSAVVGARRADAPFFSDRRRRERLSRLLGWRQRAATASRSRSCGPGRSSSAPSVFTRWKASTAMKAVVALKVVEVIPWPWSRVWLPADSTCVRAASLCLWARCPELGERPLGDNLFPVFSGDDERPPGRNRSRAVPVSWPGHRRVVCALQQLWRYLPASAGAAASSAGSRASRTGSSPAFSEIGTPAMRSQPTCRFAGPPSARMV